MRIADIAAAVAREGAAVVAMISEARGSAPREAGAAMLVTPSGATGTIGGGAVEHQALMQARSILSGACPARGLVLDYPLGPALDQCCGGHLRVAFALFGTADLPALHAARGRLALWPDGPEFEDAPAPRGVLIYGAGHVGAALVRALAPLPFAIRLIDARLGAFPTDLPPGIQTVATPLPEAEAEAAPPDALHIVLTHSHALDLEIASAVLERGDFGFLGVIGSATKKALFLRRLRARGIPECRLARLTCPIGIPGVRDKRPEVIAACVAAQLLQVRATEALRQSRETA